MSEKIRPHHLARKAILYVRQSSAHQVLHNRESSALQYAMCGRLTAPGWSHIETQAACFCETVLPLRQPAPFLFIHLSRE